MSQMWGFFGTSRKVFCSYSHLMSGLWQCQGDKCMQPPHVTVTSLLLLLPFLLLHLGIGVTLSSCHGNHSCLKSLVHHFRISEENKLKKLTQNSFPAKVTKYAVKSKPPYCPDNDKITTANKSYKIRANVQPLLHNDKDPATMVGMNSLGV